MPMEKPHGESKEQETTAQVIDMDPKSIPVVFLIVLYALIWAMRERCVC